MLWDRDNFYFYPRFLDTTLLTGRLIGLLECLGPLRLVATFHSCLYRTTREIRVRCATDPCRGVLRLGAPTESLIGFGCCNMLEQTPWMVKFFQP